MRGCWCVVEETGANVADDEGEVLVFLLMLLLLFV